MERTINESEPFTCGYCNEQVTMDDRDDHIYGICKELRDLLANPLLSESDRREIIARLADS